MIIAIIAAIWMKMKVKHENIDWKCWYIKPNFAKIELSELTNSSNSILNS